MKRLNKNFSENRKTVEAMINACGGQPSGCMCDKMIDCACGIEQHTLQAKQYQKLYTNYFAGFSGASF